MGNELKDGKLWFKAGKDDEYKEVKNAEVELIKAIDKLNNEFCNATKTICDMCNSISLYLGKRFYKKMGSSPLSKKRTRKLLMAHGFDRDTAQMYANTMKPRNMSEINELIKIKEEHIDE